MEKGSQPIIIDHEPAADAAMAVKDLQLSEIEHRFVLEYVNCFNQSKAALRAGFQHPSSGHSLMKRPHIKAAIDEYLSYRADNADAIVHRLWDIATADMNELISLDPVNGRPYIDVAKMYKAGQTGLIKRIRQTKGSIEVELHSPMEAITLLMKHRGMLTDKIQVDWRAEMQAGGHDPERIKQLIIDAITRGAGAADVGDNIRVEAADQD